MLDEKVIEEFLSSELKEQEIKIPEEIHKEAFCEYTENDFYEWLKDNYKCFFNHGKPDWGWIKEKIAKITGT